MQLLKRIGYYLVGVSLGSVAVFFFWKQKNVSFDYLPNSRTLKNISVKERLFSKEVLLKMNVMQIDTVMIADALKHGEVNFGKSTTNTKPCREYWIDAKSLQKKISLVVKNCDSTATITKILVN